ncbi:phospholipase [Bifidobacterium italicum]|uniref:Phospholipase n=1 Tax=Bifidobacterium italicum TaxID=1960968 RepID=A0A2A2EJ75_9BIFI|nr:DISARM system phospholipase D-like protein DrmC [Bifidobacterium italicum]PAU69284.1 phospholipase [Bifidobacterium italicum]
MMNMQKACIQLGQYLTGTEARDLANLLKKGYPLSAALQSAIDKSSRRMEIAELLTAIEECSSENSGIASTTLENVALLRVIEGARADHCEVTPVWTAPQGLAREGELNALRGKLLLDAKTSIMCSTYNFQRSSVLWEALEQMSKKLNLVITIYIDGSVNRRESDSDGSSAEDIARAFPQAKVFRTKVCIDDNGKEVRYRNHAKFLCVDHHQLLVTSANFSYSAEARNIELGLRIDDPRIAKSVEAQMLRLESMLYELV